MGTRLGWLIAGLLALGSTLPASAAASIELVELSGAPRVGAAVAGASSVRVANLVEEGTRTNGRILGFDPRDGEYSCSGTALNTPSRSIVLTAGHCVLEDGRTGQSLVFIPAYDHGLRPFGTFPVEVAYVMPQWRRAENPDFDVAALRVGPSELGLLTDAVGGRGYVTGRSRRAVFQIFGYPAVALDGEELRSCIARGLGSDILTFSFAGPPTVPSSCDMSTGSSGGAWVVEGRYIDGVTSYGYTGSANRVYSPYFGAAIGRFLAKLP